MNTAVSTEAKSDKPSRHRRPIVWGIVLTVAWFSGLAATGYFGSGTIVDWRRLTLNEAGDLLAGVFAAPAFLWLVATVFLQSQELRLTRKEVEENREVAKEQAAYIGAQTQILMEEAALRRAEQANRDVDLLISELFSWLSRYCGQEGCFHINIDGYSSFETYSFGLRSNDLKALVRLSEEIKHFLGGVRTARANGDLLGLSGKVEPFTGWGLRARILSLSQVSGVTKGYENMLQLAGLPDLLHGLEKLVGELEEWGLM